MGKKCASTKMKVIRVAMCLSILLLLFPLNSTVNLGAAQSEQSEYEWTQLGHDESWTNFSPGPGPNKPQVIWSYQVGSAAFFGFRGSLWIFNGKAFAIGGLGLFGPTVLYAFDALTGELLWNINLEYGGTAVTKLTDEYILVDTDTGIACYRMSDGELMWHYDILGSGETFSHPGGGLYFPGRYSPETKMKYDTKYNSATKQSLIVATKITDPETPPTEAWTYVTDWPSEILSVGGGKLFVGSYSRHCIYALNATTGELLWVSPKIGIAGYAATYADGKLFHASGSTRLTCYDADTGEILWDYDAGPRAFFAFCGGYAYGRYYQHNIDPWGGYVGCWDAETGELLWKTPAHYFIGYYCPAIADGKIYVTVSDGQEVAGEEEAPPAEFACLDAFTGEKIWSLPGVTATHAAVAYGRLYIHSGNTVYCIGEKDPVDWTYFRGNMDLPGVAVDQYGPTMLNLQWKFETGGPVTSSPAVVDGKVYIGSEDMHIYCIDVYTGEALWMFETEYRITSSPAVANGRVYTGFDDGHVYCLDADTGELIWQTDNIYGGPPPKIHVELPDFQPRSSPIVVNNRVYVGALDGKVYCLDATDGDILWTYETNGPICGSPAIYEGKIYIASTDRTLYCIDANTGNQIWNWTTPKQPWIISAQLFFFCTPTVIDGVVYIGGGATYSAMFFVPESNIILVALNATTGEVIWQVDMDLNNNTNQPYAPTYVDGILYLGDGMAVAAYNAENGSRIWYQWLGFQVHSSVAYADYPLGPRIYVGCDSYSITALDAETGEVLSVYRTGAQVDSSPAIYDGMIIVGSADHNVYCFGDKPAYCPTIVAWCDWREAYVNETIVVHSRLLPGLPNENILLTVTKPDGTMLNVSATTDSKGWADFTFTVDQTGEWTWTVWYQGHDKGYILYTYSYTDTNPLNVKTTTTQPEQPTPTWPPETLYIIIAIAAIIIIAIAAYLAKKSKK